MIYEGTIKQADKDGNDEAEHAAGKGSSDAQGSLDNLAANYSQRRGQYKKLMQRIHRCIIEMRKAEREKRKEQDEQERVRNFAKGGDMSDKKQKVLAPKYLDYMQAEECEKRQLNDVRQKYCTNDEEMEKMQHVRFLFCKTRSINF